MVNHTNTGTLPKATLRKFLRDGLDCMLFVACRHHPELNCTVGCVETFVQAAIRGGELKGYTLSEISVYRDRDASLKGVHRTPRCEPRVCVSHQSCFRRAKVEGGEGWGSVRVAATGRRKKCLLASLLKRPYCCCTVPSLKVFMPLWSLWTQSNIELELLHCSH